MSSVLYSPPLLIFAGAGAYAGCAYCTHLGEYSNSLKKMIYPGNRCFLHPSDSLRRDCVNFPSKKPDENKPPLLKTNAYIDSANDSYHRANSAERKKLVQKLLRIV